MAGKRSAIFGSIDFQQSPPGQPHGEQDFVVPEDIAVRAWGLVEDGVGQSDRLARFGVPFGLYGDAGGLVEIVEDRLGEFLVLGRVADDFRPTGSPASGEKGKEEQSEDWERLENCEAGVAGIVRGLMGYDLSDHCNRYLINSPRRSIMERDADGSPRF